VDWVLPRGLDPKAERCALAVGAKVTIDCQVFATAVSVKPAKAEAAK
jgi:hypothetical protein